MGDTKSFDGKNDDRTSGYQTKSDSGSPPPSPDADKETSPTITLGGSDFFIIKPSQEGEVITKCIPYENGNASNNLQLLIASLRCIIPSKSIIPAYVYIHF